MLLPIYDSCNLAVRGLCPSPRACEPGVIPSQTLGFLRADGNQCCCEILRDHLQLLQPGAPFCAWLRRPQISTMSQQASPWQALTASLSGLGQALAELPRHTSRCADTIGAAVQDGRRDLAANFMSRQVLFTVSNKAAIKLLSQDHSF